MDYVRYCDNSRIFPCKALFTNLDYLIDGAKELGPPATALTHFPWIAWFIWKVRNDKVFKGKDVDPRDTLLLAMAESEAWTAAQAISNAIDDRLAPAEHSSHTATA